MCFMTILFFFGVHFLSPDPHLSRFQGGAGGGSQTHPFSSLRTVSWLDTAVRFPPSLPLTQDLSFLLDPLQLGFLKPD